MTDSEQTFLSRKRQWFQWLRASLIALIALRVSGIWLLEPAPALSGALGLTLILVAFIWPVLKQDLKSALWLSFVSCLFFTIGVLNAMTEGRMVFGLVESILAAIVFTSAMFFSRNGYKALEARATATPQ